MSKETTMLTPMEMHQELLRKKSRLLEADGTYSVKSLFRHFPLRSAVGIDITKASYPQLEEVARTIQSVKDARVLLNTPDTVNFGDAPLTDWIKDVKLRQAVLAKTETLKAINALQQELSKTLSRKELRQIGIVEQNAAFDSIPG